MSALPPAKANTWQRLAGLHDVIDAALARDGAVRIAWRSANGTAHDSAIKGTLACPTRFELLDGGGRAVADGKRVLFGRNFAGFGLAEDEVPVMLLTVGPERAGNWPQKPRMPVADVLDFV